MQQNVYAKCKTIYINMILCRNESLNSDGHQFHQHQQNQQPPFTSNDLTQKIPRRRALEIHMLDCDSLTKCGGVKSVNRITTPSL